MHNLLCVLPEVKRRRTIKQVDSVAVVSSDNYVVHHTFTPVKRDLTEANVKTPPLLANATDSIQWCDTDLNSCLKQK